MALPAQPPRIPPSTPALEAAAEKRRRYLREREWLEGRSMVRALILLAIVALLASMVRAGFGRVFIHRWWHP